MIPLETKLPITVTAISWNSIYNNKKTSIKTKFGQIAKNDKEKKGVKK